MKNKKIISSMIFLVILALLFVYITNVFRPSEGYNRSHIWGMESQENLDAVYIGGSACFVYWQPLRAWNDCGFTSYNYAVDGLDATSIEYMIKNVEKRMQPELYIIDVRPFQLWTEEGNIGPLRSVADNWSVLSYNRFNLISNFFNKHVVNDSPISYFLDITNYHSNQKVLESSNSWNYASEYEPNYNQGWEWIDRYQYLEAPQEFETLDKTEMLESNKKTLIELCEYGKKHKLNLLFVVCPYYIEREHQEAYNSIEDIVSSYDYNFLNANQYYDEIGIDFSKDFYNRRHVNCFGAEKYTVFLEKYIIENYEMLDHRDDDDYALWNKQYEKFREEESKHKESVLQMMYNDLRGHEQAENLKRTNNINDWFLLTEAEAERYTLFIYNNRIEMSDKDTIFLGIQKKWGICNNEEQLILLSNNSIINSTKVDEKIVVDGKIGKDSPTNGVPYRISEDSLIINNKEYWKNNDGIIVVVVDNNLCNVADCVYISEGADGKYKLER